MTKNLACAQPSTTMLRSENPKRGMLLGMWKRMLQHHCNTQPQEKQPDRWSETRHHEVMMQRQRTGDEVLYRYRHSKQQESFRQASLHAQSTFGNEPSTNEEPRAADDTLATATSGNGFSLKSQLSTFGNSARYRERTQKPLSLDDSISFALTEQDCGADEEPCISEGCDPSISQMDQTMLTESSSSLSDLMTMSSNSHRLHTHTEPLQPCSELECSNLNVHDEQFKSQQKALEELAALRIQHGAFLHVLPGVRAASSLSDQIDGDPKRSQKKKKRRGRWLGGSESKCLEKCFSTPQER
eukprot:scaffold142771_cov40-Tisochrysis_lutea.AAC.1